MKVQDSSNDLAVQTIRSIQESQLLWIRNSSCQEVNVAGLFLQQSQTFLQPRLLNEESARGKAEVAETATFCHVAL